MLIGAVIIAGNGAGADVYALADYSIANVAQMVGLAANCDGTVLHFDEIADVDLVIKARPRANAGIGPNTAVLADFSSVDEAEGSDFGPGRNPCVFQNGVSAHSHTITELDVALEYTADVYRYVPAAGKLTANINASRVWQGDPLLQQFSRILTLIDTLKVR